MLTKEKYLSMSFEEVVKELSAINKAKDHCLATTAVMEDEFFLDGNELVIKVYFYNREPMVSKIIPFTKDNYKNDETVDIVCRKSQTYDEFIEESKKWDFTEIKTKPNGKVFIYMKD